MIIVFCVISYLSIALAFSIFLILITRKKDGAFRFYGDVDTFIISLSWPITFPIFIICSLFSLFGRLLKKIEEEINKLS